VRLQVLTVVLLLTVQLLWADMISQLVNSY